MIHVRPLGPGGSPGFSRRLGYFLVGLAIGCVLLGLYHAARRASMASPSGVSGPSTPAK